MLCSRPALTYDYTTQEQIKRGIIRPTRGRRGRPASRFVPRYITRKKGKIKSIWFSDRGGRVYYREYSLFERPYKVNQNKKRFYNQPTPEKMFIEELKQLNQYRDHGGPEPSTAEIKELQKIYNTILKLKNFDIRYRIAKEEYGYNVRARGLEPMERTKSGALYVYPNILCVQISDAREFEGQANFIIIERKL